MSYLGDVFPDEGGCEPDEAARPNLGYFLQFSIRLLPARETLENVAVET